MMSSVANRKSSFDIRVQLILIVLLVAVAACQKWPPEQDALIDHYMQKRAEFDALADKIESSEYLTVSHGGYDGGVHVTTRDRQRQLLAGPEGEGFRQLLESAGIFLVIRDAEFVSATPYRNTLRSGEILSVSFLRGMEVRDEENCSVVGPSAPAKRCLLKLDEHWSLSYSWE